MPTETRSSRTSTATGGGVASGDAELLVDELADLIRGAVLVTESTGKPIHHAVAATADPTGPVVTAIVRRDAAPLLPVTWAEPDALGWAVEPCAAGMAFSWRGGEGSGMTVILATDDPPPMDAHVLELINEIRTALECPPDLDLTPAEAALLRLVDGNAGPGDDQLLGMPIAGARLVVVRRCSEGGAQLRRLLAGDRELVHAPHRGGHLVVLARDLPRRTSDDRALRAATRVAALARKVDARTVTGISAGIPDSAWLATAMADALDAAAIAAADDRPWVGADEVWARITVQRLRRVLADALTLGNPLHVLTAYENKHGVALASTVGAWVANNGDTAATAEELSVHHNTLRYRIRRAEDIAGLNLNDANQRLVAHLVLSP